MRSRRRRGRTGLGPGLLGQSGVAYAAPRILYATPKPAASPTSVATTGPFVSRTINIPAFPGGLPGFRIQVPTLGPGGAATPPTVTVVPPAPPVVQQPTSVGPQVPAMIMPPGGGMTDQGYTPPAPPAMMPSDGGSGGGAASISDGGTAPASAPAGTTAGPPWGLIALGALALGGLYLATR